MSWLARGGGAALVAGSDREGAPDLGFAAGAGLDACFDGRPAAAFGVAGLPLAAVAGDALVSLFFGTAALAGTATFPAVDRVGAGRDAAPPFAGFPDGAPLGPPFEGAGAFPAAFLPVVGDGAGRFGGGVLVFADPRPAAGLAAPFADFPRAADRWVAT